MNAYLALPLLLGVGLVQSVLLPRVNLFGGRIDLALLVVISWSVVRGLDEGMVWGFVGGLIVDLFSGGPVGATALALMTVGFLAGQAWGEGLSPLLRLLILSAVSALVYHALLLFILASTGYPVAWRFSILRVVGPSVLINAALSPFVWRLLAWLDRKTRREGLVF